MLAWKGIAAIHEQPLSLIRFNPEENVIAELFNVGDRSTDATHIDAIT